MALDAGLGLVRAGWRPKWPKTWAFGQVAFGNLQTHFALRAKFRYSVMEYTDFNVVHYEERLCRQKSGRFAQPDFCDKRLDSTGLRFNLSRPYKLGLGPVSVLDAFFQKVNPDGRRPLKRSAPKP